MAFTSAALSGNLIPPNLPGFSAASSTAATAGSSLEASASSHWLCLRPAIDVAAGAAGAEAAKYRTAASEPDRGMASPATQSCTRSEVSAAFKNQGGIVGLTGITTLSCTGVLNDAWTKPIRYTGNSQLGPSATSTGEPAKPATARTLAACRAARPPGATLSTDEVPFGADDMLQFLEMLTFTPDMLRMPV